MNNYFFHKTDLFALHETVMFSATFLMSVYLFLPQKMDLGPCSKIHEAALKADFELASKKRDFGYDIDVSITTSSRSYFYVI